MAIPTHTTPQERNLLTPREYSGASEYIIQRKCFNFKITGKKTRKEKDLNEFNLFCSTIEFVEDGTFYSQFATVSLVQGSIV
jgi:hypothetical protein